MSHEFDKEQHSKRIHQKETVLEKKMRLAKEFNHEHALKNPHRYHKASLFNCGDASLRILRNE